MNFWHGKKEWEDRKDVEAGRRGGFEKKDLVRNVIQRWVCVQDLDFWGGEGGGERLGGGGKSVCSVHSIFLNLEVVRINSIQ